MHGVEHPATRVQTVPANGTRPTAATVISLFAGIVSASVIYDGLPPILPILSASFGGGQYGDLIAQLTTTLPILGMALSGMLSGMAIERLGIKRILLFAIFAYAMVGSLGLMLTSALPLLASRLVTGVAAGTMMTCGSTIVAQFYGGIQQTRMMGLLFAVGAICSLTFVFISGAVATIWWRAPFLLHGIVGLIFIVPTFCLPRQAQSLCLRGNEVNSFSLQALYPALPAYLMIAALLFLSSLFTIQITFLAAESGTTSPVTIANICMVYALIVFVGNISIGRVSTRLGLIRTLRLAFWLVTAGTVICASSEQVSGIAIGGGIGGLGVGLGIPAILKLIILRVPLWLAPRALGFGITMMYLGASAAPVVIVPISGALTLRGTYYFLAALIAIFVTVLTLADFSGSRRKNGRQTTE